MASSVTGTSARPDAVGPAAAERRSLRLDGPVLAFAAGLVVLAAFLLHQSRGTTFFFDEWNVWSGRYGFSDLDRPFAPINGHLSAVPILIFSVLTKVFGAESLLPFRISVVVFHLVFLSLLFVFARRRLGGWIALAVVAPTAVPATAWIVLMMPFTGLFQIGPLIAALGAVLALELRARWADAVAMAALLFLAILTAGSGLAALAAVAVYLLATDGLSRGLLARAWVVGLPALAYAAWWLHYRPDTDTEAANVAYVAGYVVRGMDSGVAGYLTITNWAGAISFGIFVLAVLAVWQRRATAVFVLTMATAAVGFWALIALARAPQLGPEEVRYVYANIALTLLVALAAVPAVRAKRPQALIVSAIAVPIVLAQVHSFRAQAANYRNQSLITQTDLFVLNATRKQIDPDFVFPDGDPQLHPGSYLNARRLWGGPAGLSEAEVAGGPATVRGRADRIFMAVHLVGLVPEDDPRVLPGPLPGEAPALAAASATPRGDCLRITPAGGQAQATFSLAAPSGLVVRDPAGRVEVRVARFGDVAAVAELGRVERGQARAVVFRTDASRRPWQVNLRAEREFVVCGARP